MAKKATTIPCYIESNRPYGATPDFEPKSCRVIFQGIPGICEPHTIEMKIPKSRNPKEPGLTMTYEEYSLPKARKI